MKSTDTIPKNNIQQNNDQNRMLLNVNNNKNMIYGTLIKNQKTKSKKCENTKIKKISTINNIINPCYSIVDKQHKVKTEKVSPATIHNKIINQLNHNEKNVPTVIFNLNSNNCEANYMNNNSSNKYKQIKESKSNSKTKSDNKKKIITNYNKINNNSNTTYTSYEMTNTNSKTKIIRQTYANTFTNMTNKKTNNKDRVIKKNSKINNTKKNLTNSKINQNKIMNKNQIKNVNLRNSFKNNNNNTLDKKSPKKNIGTSITSFSSTKPDYMNKKNINMNINNMNKINTNILELQYINNFIAKNQKLTNSKTNPTTTKNFLNNLKEYNNINNNKNKTEVMVNNSTTTNVNNINNNNEKGNANINYEIISIHPNNKNKNMLIQNFHNLKSFINKYSIGSQINSKIKHNNKKKDTNKMKSLKNISIVYKINNNNLSQICTNNQVSKSYANSRKKLNINNSYKTDMKINSNIKSTNKKSAKSYCENINHNLFPITISQYKNNFININININNNTNNNISNNNLKKENLKNNSKKKINPKTSLTGNNSKIINNMNKKHNPIILTSSLLQSESYIKSKKYQGHTLSHKFVKRTKNNYSYFNNKKGTNFIFQNLTNAAHKNKINNNLLIVNDINNCVECDNNNITVNKNNYSTISQKDYNYYNEESIKLSNVIKSYANKNNYPKTNLSYYKIGRSIGHGAFGKVNIALDVLSGHIVAIKSFNKKKQNFPLHKILYEIKLLKKLRGNKNIITFFEHFETEKHFCIVMENASGGNLLTAINKMTKLPENLAKNIFKQLIQTIKYIHNNNIVHRDIKPDNILLELNNTIKICDFGVSKEIKQGKLINDACGTPAFIAPEILKDEPYDPYKTDIWSCGVVLFAMITGFFPFRGINERELNESILSGNYPKIKDIPEELRNLMDRLLEINPDKRINIEEILNHKWLESCDNNVNIFTNAEKIMYGKLKIDYRKSNKENLVENFTYHNMETDYEEENQNIQSQSFIKTPFNSRRQKDYDDDLYYDDVNIENNIMKFMPKVGELSRMYEIHNNCDYDQGYIISKKYKDNQKKISNSKNNSYEKSNQKKECNKENIQEISEYKNQNSNNEVSYNSFIDKKYNKIIKFVANDKIIKFVESLGYKKDFILRSLHLNEVNHATASYYLKLSLLNE